MLSSEEASQNVVKAIGKGLLKTISKMGISTIQSYRSAQIFEAVGLSRELIDRHFTGTASRIGGVGLPELAQEALERHARAWAAGSDLDDILPVGGVYAWRRDGEHHIWNPETIALVQHAVRATDDALLGAALAGDEQAHASVRESPAYARYREYAQAVNEDAARRATLRGLLKLRSEAGSVGVGASAGGGSEGEGEGEGRIALEEVEPAKEIVRRFCTGAMSLGSISREAHETLAIAMNRLGGRSNTGEGGEDPVRFLPDPNGDRRRSAIKQVASGRFGVTIHYLVNADELQIKMAQGAKPGEGGQLPGHKVDKYIGSIRHTTPGVGLISPPPHHDIYSIEDLKQLIYDLRCANPQAQVSVKLVSEVGVGTVAAGVSKANADRVLIAGHDGGTGASPLSSIQAAGVPWEIGLAETQQTLLLNELRSRIVVQTDGQLKTGRDVLIAALLGADEMGFSTAPADRDRLHHDARLPPQHLPGGDRHPGPRAAQALPGDARACGQLLLLRRRGSPRAAGLAGAALARRGDRPRGPAGSRPRDRPLEGARRGPHPHPHPRGAGPDGDNPAAACSRRRRCSRTRSTGSWWSAPGRRSNGASGCRCSCRSATSTAAWGGSSPATSRARTAPRVSRRTRSWSTSRAPPARASAAGWRRGWRFTLHGDANDYAGKGLSGGVIAVRPREGMSGDFVAERNVIVGNTVLYGATAGKAFFRGLAGERFAVRNSGAWAVVEGVGDHGCEYMTGGRVVVLGPTGRNFAAGMSGGIAYVLDEEGAFAKRCNMGMVDFEALTGARDAVELRAMVAEHEQRTDSPVARRVLAEWEELLARGAFVKVMPRDYKRVLAELAAEEEQAEGVAAA